MLSCQHTLRRGEITVTQMCLYQQNKSKLCSLLEKSINVYRNLLDTSTYFYRQQCKWTRYIKRLKQLVTDMKSSIRSNPVWFIFPKSLQIFQYVSGKKKLQNKNGLNQTFLKTALINSFRLQIFHRTISITKTLLRLP